MVYVSLICVIVHVISFAIGLGLKIITKTFKQAEMTTRYAVFSLSRTDPVNDWQRVVSSTLAGTCRGSHRLRQLARNTRHCADL